MELAAAHFLAANWRLHRWTNAGRRAALVRLSLVATGVLTFLFTLIPTNFWLAAAVPQFANWPLFTASTCRGHARPAVRASGPIDHLAGRGAARSRSSAADPGRFSTPQKREVPIINNSTKNAGFFLVSCSI